MPPHQFLPLSNQLSADVQAYGVNQATGVFSGNDIDSTNWNPLSVSKFFDAANYAAATSNVNRTSTNFVTSNGNYAITSQDDTYGTIATTGGTVSISIPYTLSVVTASSGGSCCYDARAGWGIFLINESDNGIVDEMSGQYAENLEPTSSYSTPGVISLTDSGLPDGSYEFYAFSFSQVRFVPEPGTLSLLCAGLFGLIAISFWKLNK